jgi:tripartite-type tricarboxylate transporter receptor subunit TctC
LVWGVAPKGVPQSILDRVTDALDSALDDVNVRKRLFEIGGAVPLSTLIRNEIAQWGPIIKAANVTLD